MMTQVALDEWKNEGGVPAQSEAGSCQAARTDVTSTLRGTDNQIDWAEQIRKRVGQDFDRVANAMKSVASRQVERDRTDTLALIAILQEKRTEVMSRAQAGYFIHDWQEPGNQVRQMIIKDPRYDTIKAGQAARKRALKSNPQ